MTSPSFSLDTQTFAQSASWGDALKQPAVIDSEQSFNEFCQELCALWNASQSSAPVEPSEQFQELMGEIEAGAVEDRVIPTPWGGVVVMNYEHPEVEKFLVVKKGGYLALETHAEKQEHLEVKEGSGVLVYRAQADQPLHVVELQPGDTYSFAPGEEHCIIATENLIVFERSTDPKGMDQDLIFFYTPSDPPQ